MPNSKREPQAYQCAAQYELVLEGESRDLFLREIGFLTASKQMKAEAWLTAKKRKSNKDRFTDRVQSIQSAGITDVYCTTEGETHSIIANGFVTAQCGEQPLLPGEPCNLGPLNRPAFVTGETGAGRWEVPRLKETVGRAIGFLQDVIGVNNYPLPEIEQLAKGNRRIGLGVMGWAEALVKSGTAYGDPGAQARRQGHVLHQRRLARRLRERPPRSAASSRTGRTRPTIRSRNISATRSARPATARAPRSRPPAPSPSRRACREAASSRSSPSPTRATTPRPSRR